MAMVSVVMGWECTDCKKIVEKSSGEHECPKRLVNGGYELGKAYFCDYWRQYFLVVALVEGEDWCVATQWHDGHTTSHFTTLGYRDREVSMEEYEQACKRYETSRRGSVWDLDFIQKAN